MIEKRISTWLGLAGCVSFCREQRYITIDELKNGKLAGIYGEHTIMRKECVELVFIVVGNV